MLFRWIKFENETVSNEARTIDRTKRRGVSFKMSGNEI